MSAMSGAEMDVRDVLENVNPVDLGELAGELWPVLFALLLERIDTLNVQLEGVSREIKFVGLAIASRGDL